MPSRNVVKEFAPHQYFHVYNRGVEKRDIFLDDEDYVVFLSLIKKFITGEKENITHRHKVNSMGNEVTLLAYCLMPNHFHLMIYQDTADGITKFMRKVATSYSMYFNKKYSRVGSLFQGRYRASNINADDYLHHISRYIHLNPKNYKSYQYSSLKYYLSQKKTPLWLSTKEVLSLFDNSSKEYEEFIDDYKESNNELSVLKWQLANSIEEY